MSKPWQYLLEIHAPSTQEQMLMTNLRFAPGNARHWKPLLHLISRRIPKVTSMRNYLVVTLKNPIKALGSTADGGDSADSLLALLSSSGIRTKRFVVTGVTEVEGVGFVADILDWTRGALPKVADRVSLNDLKTGVLSIDVVQILKSRMDQLILKPLKAKASPSQEPTPPEERPSSIRRARMKDSVELAKYYKVLVELDNPKLAPTGSWFKHEGFSDKKIEERLKKYGGALGGDAWLVGLAARDWGTLLTYVLVAGNSAASAVASAMQTVPALFASEDTILPPAVVEPVGAYWKAKISDVGYGHYELITGTRVMRKDVTRL